MQDNDEQLLRLLKQFVKERAGAKKTKKKRASSNRPPVALTEAELVKVLELARRHRLRDWVLILITYRHGLRASEALGIRRRDVDSGSLRIRRRKDSEVTEQPLLGHRNPLLDEQEAFATWLGELKAHGKKGAAKAGGRTASKTLHSTQNVKFSTDPDDLLFPITRVRYYQLFRHYCELAGLPPRKRSPHKLKHSCAKHLLRSNVPVNEVQAWLGWKSIATANHYTRADADEVASSVDRAIRGKDSFSEIQQASLFEGKAGAEEQRKL